MRPQHAGLVAAAAVVAAAFAIAAAPTRASAAARGSATAPASAPTAASAPVSGTAAAPALAPAPSAVPALGSAAAPAAAPPAPPSHNVTGKDGKVPSLLTGDQYECARTNPEMTIIDGSEVGTVRVGTNPGHLKFDVKSEPAGLLAGRLHLGGQQPRRLRLGPVQLARRRQGVRGPGPGGQGGHAHHQHQAAHGGRLRGRRRVRHLDDRHGQEHRLRDDGGHGGGVQPTRPRSWSG